MSVTEELQGMGSWNLKLTYPPQAVYNYLRNNKYSTFYVVWGAITDSMTVEELEARAEYSGVVLEKEHNSIDNYLTISGASLAWWLGDIARRGPAIGVDLTVDVATIPSEVLTNVWSSTMQNPGLTLGTLSDPDVNAPNPTWQGLLSYKTTLRQVLDQLATDCNCSWRVNVDGSIDFGPADSLFETDNPFLIGVHPLDPKHMITHTSGRNALTNLWLESDEGEARAFVASITKGYKASMYEQSGIYETSGFGSEEELTQAIVALLNARFRPDDRAVVVYDIYHRAQEWINVGDSVDIYDRYALWESSHNIDSIFGYIPVKRLVVNTRTWSFDENMSFFVVAPGSTVGSNLTPWAQIPQTEATVTFTCGDDIDTLYNRITGAIRITTPVADIAGGTP